MRGSTRVEVLFSCFWFRAEGLGFRVPSNWRAKNEGLGNVRFPESMPAR